MTPAECGTNHGKIENIKSIQTRFSNNKTSSACPRTPTKARTVNTRHSRAFLSTSLKELCVTHRPFGSPLATIASISSKFLPVLADVSMYMPCMLSANALASSKLGFSTSNYIHHLLFARKVDFLHPRLHLLLTTPSREVPLKTSPEETYQTPRLQRLLLSTINYVIPASR